MGVLVVLLFICVAPAWSASFQSAEYDPKRDELVVTLAYRGTNPDHRFSLEWGQCETRAGSPQYEIAGRVHDDQWNDLAREPFTRTVRFSLSDLRCRPATVTLFTAPDFRISVLVPERQDQPSKQ